MAHYARLDENNIVVSVFVGKDENDSGVYWEQYYCAKRTSYNTLGGVYYDQTTGLPHEDQSKAFRKNYAGVGYTYDEQRDAFISPKPYASWVFNEESCQWYAPVPYPQDRKKYLWDEVAISWVEQT